MQISISFEQIYAEAASSMLRTVSNLKKFSNPLDYTPY